MWKLKFAECDSPWLHTTNNHVGREVWEFDPNLGTSEERAAVEKAREEFTKNRLKNKISSDFLLRLQLAKENTLELNLPQIRLAEHEAVTDEAISTSLRRALSRFAALQVHDGHWPEDFCSPMYLTPGLIIVLSVTGSLNTVLTAEHQREIVRYIYNHQNEDGGWGLHVEDRSSMLTTVTTYVTLRLLGKGPDDEDGTMQKVRKWILDHGSATHLTTLGKLWLSVLGAYEWSGMNPLPPEMWLLPRIVPFHPGKMWLHTRLLLQSVSYLYGKRFVGPITPTVLSLREEIYAIPYSQIDWDTARTQCAKEDLYYPHPIVQYILWTPLQKVVEPVLMHWPGNKLREKALKTVIKHIHYEDDNSRYVLPNAISKMLNVLCCWVDDPNSEAFKMHIPRIYDHLWIAEDGMKMKVTNGSQLWETAFSVHAIISTGFLKEFGPTLKKAHKFLHETQLRENPSGDFRSWYREIAKGAWPFTTGDNGFVVSDCTAEALKAALMLSQISRKIVGDPIADDRIFDAVNILLSLPNPDGGYPSYEVAKTYAWLEVINPEQMLKGLMIDISYVECTSSVIQSLVLFRKLYPEHRSEEIKHCIMKAVNFIENQQQPDGSWFGSWGICFTYGTWFGVMALTAIGKNYENCSRIRKACEFLLSKQLPSGGWGESYRSCHTKVYTNLEGNRPNAVNTAWAMLALLHAGQADEDPKPLHHAAKELINMQTDSGEFPVQEMMGMYLRTCTLNYASYRYIFPIWALGEYHKSFWKDATEE